MYRAKRSGTRQDFRRDVGSPKVLTTSATLIVLTIAIMVRIPSCYQSFWVDELHSAWCIWDSLGDVAKRATIGNQSPVYFGGLWFWKQAFGGSELALRMSSVLMTSIAAAVMTVGVSRWTTSPMAGLASGLVMALESNAIFFGTELRPYAAVILCATVATLSFVRLLESDDSREAWNLLAISTLIAFMVQPTAIAVLSILFLLLVLCRFGRPSSDFGFSGWNAMLLGSYLVGAWAIWNWTLAESLESRQQWTAFAVAPSFWGRRRGVGLDLAVAVAPMLFDFSVQDAFPTEEASSCVRRICRGGGNVLVLDRIAGGRDSSVAPTLLCRRAADVCLVGRRGGGANLVVLCEGRVVNFSVGCPSVRGSCGRLRCLQRCCCCLG